MTVKVALSWRAQTLLKNPYRIRKLKLKWPTPLSEPNRTQDLALDDSPVTEAQNI